MKTYLLTLLMSLIGLNIAFSQCNPPAALNCESALALCSLDELNDYQCVVPDISNPTGPSPICFGVGVPNNTIWWSFYGNGQEITISIFLDVADCRDQKGIEAGIMDDCGGDLLDCNADCGLDTVTLTWSTKKCRKYYFFIDGCDGDVCSYRMVITNGEPPALSDPIPIPEVVKGACSGGLLNVCVAELQNACEASLAWTVDGVDLPAWDDKHCIQYSVSDNVNPIEVCVIFTVGDPNNPIGICAQEQSCITVVPDSIRVVNEGDVYFCWEDHEGGSAEWHGMSIDSVCNDSICVVYERDGDGCLVKYTADSFILLPPRHVMEKYVFICDMSVLPYITEDGREWKSSVCGEEISWSDSNYHNCDTMYILYLDIFDPTVTLSLDCTGCDSTTYLRANIDYNPDCVNGSVSWMGFWLNAFLDTIGSSDSLLITKRGTYRYVMRVKYMDAIFSEMLKCDLDGGKKPWTINVDDQKIIPAISGESNLCLDEQGIYKVTNTVGVACSYDWFIQEGDGQIVTQNPTDTNQIAIEWNHAAGDTAQVCVRITSDCGESEKTCLTVSFLEVPLWEDVQFECDSTRSNYLIRFTSTVNNPDSVEIVDTSGWKATHLGNGAFVTPWIANGQRVFLILNNEAGCSGSPLDTVYDCTGVAVSDISTSYWHIYPNPAFDYIIIEGEDLNKMKVVVQNIQGNSISLPLSLDEGGRLRLNVQPLTPGIYYLILSNEDSREIKKVVIL